MKFKHKCVDMLVYIPCQGKQMELLCIKQWISGLLPTVSYSLKAALMINYDPVGPNNGLIYNELDTDHLWLNAWCIKPVGGALVRQEPEYM
ncbi:hypothetical protein Ahy_A01g004553 isoform C [Arachis hypogaea]|uniref:Uncharacterized protein n=1 Tax=Arachis hypogaea TaxID=3818 RepID=A0A445EWE9_ARAHY|nr:hypothetical protein Ahy_A01g004553 isoform C [Arachis hypogaea]